MSVRAGPIHFKTFAFGFKLPRAGRGSCVRPMVHVGGLRLPLKHDAPMFFGHYVNFAVHKVVVTLCADCVIAFRQPCKQERAIARDV